MEKTYLKQLTRIARKDSSGAVSSMFFFMGAWEVKPVQKKALLEF